MTIQKCSMRSQDTVLSRGTCQPGPHQRRIRDDKGWSLQRIPSEDERIRRMVGQKVVKRRLLNIAHHSKNIWSPWTMEDVLKATEAILLAKYCGRFADLSNWLQLVCSKPTEDEKTDELDATFPADKPLVSINIYIVRPLPKDNSVRQFLHSLISLRMFCFVSYALKTQGARFRNTIYISTGHTRRFNPIMASRLRLSSFGTFPK